MTTLLRSSWSWLSLLAFTALLSIVPAGHARLRPYHVIESGAWSQARPRILFVLDTSGSMSERARPGGGKCDWAACETGSGEDQSRIAAARQVIRDLVVSTGDQAKFALMTFEQMQPPTNKAPKTCADGNRFEWVTQYGRDYLSSDWSDIERHPGQVGAWRLCQGDRKRPYPYLRWDELGVGPAISQNDADGAPPPSPLVSTAAMSNVANAQRKVQWFPHFMGVRFQPNATTDSSRAITHASVGDYGDETAELDANVWGHDFYYWPYVDGFPGYATWTGSPQLGNGEHNVGVVGEDNSTNAAQLYAPFYLDLSQTSINPNYWGPATPQQAEQMVLDKTSTLMQGGVDVVGESPWRSVIGNLSNAPANSNGVFSHTTVGSYLRFLQDVETPDACAPTVVVLLTDGAPSPSNEGGGHLYSRLAALRTELGVPVYVVGMYSASNELDAMACAAAGACDGANCDTPCDDAPANAWDTCADANDPGHSCAYTTSSTAELRATLGDIVDRILDFDIQSGPGAVVNDFGAASGGGTDDDAIQTVLSARTEVAHWRGHVVRSYCDTRDDNGDLLPHCVPPNPEFLPAEHRPTFGPCPQSRSWDAGECLQQTAWTDRRLFTHTTDGTVIAIADGSGRATPQLVAELQSLGLVGGAGAQAAADAWVAFVLGRDAPAGWKLPGLANASPIVVRRIPQYRPQEVPEVAIRDPHCGGRMYPPSFGGTLPRSLHAFAESAWDENDPERFVAQPEPHHVYQEAVLIGDDMGVLHAFALDSGNELWGFVPRALLANVSRQVAHGAATMGQPAELDDHIYGISATVNQAWVPDPGPDAALGTSDDTWRHLAVFGFGAGGYDYVALDVSHMSPAAPQGSIEIVWTSDDPSLSAAYDALNGETWARPALTYHVPGDYAANAPKALLVMGSGYPSSPGAPAGQGRTLLVADALTGQIQQSATLPGIGHAVYESDFGAVVDPAVVSHCRSRFWAEAQEAYVADPAGRLFRWDLGRETSHAADGGHAGPWSGSARPVPIGSLDHFPACTSTGATCSVSASNPGDVFVFPAAVSANDRIDDPAAAAAGQPPGGTDRVLVALISGSAFEDTIEGQDPANDFHSSLYLLVDDHFGPVPKDRGFTIPEGAPKLSGAIGPATALDAGHTGYLRVALSDVQRTRTFVPYEGASAIAQTRNFSKATRPVRAPRILVKGVVDRGEGETEDVVVDGVEVYFVEFTVYEPPQAVCDSDFYDAGADAWHEDRGETYVLRFRLTADAERGFDFTTGTDSTKVDFGAGFTRGLVFEGAEQQSSGGCTAGNCGAAPDAGAGGRTPCTSGAGLDTLSHAPHSIPLRTATLRGFGPIE